MNHDYNQATKLGNRPLKMFIETIWGFNFNIKSITVFLIK